MKVQGIEEVKFLLRPKSGGVGGSRYWAVTLSGTLLHPETPTKLPLKLFRAVAGAQQDSEMSLLLRQRTPVSPNGSLRPSQFPVLPQNLRGLGIIF